MKMKISCLVVALLGLSAEAAIACTPAHQFKTVTPGKLTVVTMMIPPFSIPEQGTLKGVDGDIISKIAEMECLTVEPVVVDARAVMQYVVTGRADVAIGNWYRTALRMKSVDMSEPVYLDSMAIYSKQGTSSVNALRDSGKVIGTIQGYNYVSDLQKVLGSNVKLYPSPVALVQDLEAGRIEAGIESYSSGVYAQQQNSLQGFKIVHVEPDKQVRASVEPAQIAFALAKGNTALKQALDESIIKLRNDKTIAKTLDGYGLSAQDSEVGSPRAIE